MKFATKKSDMNRVIKNYSKLHLEKRDEVYIRYSEGDIERTTFPYKGEIVEGVIYQEGDIVYLIPISTIIDGRTEQPNNYDDDDDNDQESETDDDIEIDWNEE